MNTLNVPKPWSCHRKKINQNNLYNKSPTHDKRVLAFVAFKNENSISNFRQTTYFQGLFPIEKKLVEIHGKDHEKFLFVSMVKRMSRTSRAAHLISKLSNVISVRLQKHDSKHSFWKRVSFDQKMQWRSRIRRRKPEKITKMSSTEQVQRMRPNHSFK